jgi:hypothetical protein
MADNELEDLLQVVPTQADKNRLDAVWKGLADMPEHTQVNPKNRMDLWAIEHQMRANRL